MNPEPEFQTLNKLLRQEKAAASTLGDAEARFLVASYYQFQENRIRTNNQVFSVTGTDEPHVILAWLATQNRLLEDQIKGALDTYSKQHMVGEWMRTVLGIGPVISAGVLAHIDIYKAPTVGHIWSFAGLVPGVVWGKGEKRPWNADLKVLLWKAGESFVKVSGNEKAFYGQLYKKRKELETQNNDKGLYADQAKHILATKNIGKDTDAYKAYIQGKLPPAHIHARAKRYAVKRFIADLHTVWYWKVFNRLPPLPYPIAHLDHAHYEASFTLSNIPELWDALLKSGAVPVPS